MLSLRDVLRNGSTIAKIVLVRRSHFRLGKIAERLEVLGGYLIAYLNLDEVIRIIREEDDPKAVMMTALQAHATCRSRRSSTCGSGRCASSRRSRSARSSMR